MSIDKNKSINILLIQFRPAGDVLLLTPAVIAIKKNFRYAKVSFLVNEKESEIINDLRLIDNIITIKKLPKNNFRNYIKYIIYTLSVAMRLRKNNYDVVIDFIGNPKSALLTLMSGAQIRIGRKLRVRRFAYNKIIEYDKNLNTVKQRLLHLAPLGIEADFIPPELVLSDKHLLYAKNYIRNLKIDASQSIIFFAPNSPRTSRKWKAEYFISVGKSLKKKHNAKILLAWGPGEEEYTRKIAEGIGCDAQMIPVTNLMEMAAIISLADLMITNDGGVKHISNAVGVRTITIYGPTNPAVWNDPDIEKNPALAAQISCIFCEKNECPMPDHYCMINITPDQVLKYAEGILNKF